MLRGKKLKFFAICIAYGLKLRLNLNNVIFSGHADTSKKEITS